MGFQKSLFSWSSSSREIKTHENFYRVYSSTCVLKLFTKLKTTKNKFIGLLEDFTNIVSPENYRLYGIPIELQRLLSSLWLSRVCTCVCVCLFVVFCHRVHLYPEIIIIGTYVFTATRKTLYIGIIIAIFAENASF